MTWMRTDERNEAIKSLHKTYQFILEIREDNYNWKWAIISLHNSAQAFMVLSLKGTANFNVIREPEKLFDAIQNRREYPEEYLLGFGKLYKDIKSPKKMKQNTASRIYPSSKDSDYAMEKLNEFRNNFIHFIPCRWSIELAMLPGIFNQVLSVLEFLILESGNIRFYYDDEGEKRCLSELIEKIRAELNKLESEYAMH